MSEPDPLESPWHRRSRQLVYENPWVSVLHDEVDRPDGRPGIYGVIHFLNHAVAIVAIDEQDRVVLVGQWRYTLDAYSWELPEGGVPPDETPLAGAQRELREETGVEAPGLARGRPGSRSRTRSPTSSARSSWPPTCARARRARTGTEELRVAGSRSTTPWR